MFALGAIESIVPSEANEHLKLGGDLTATCHKAYDSTPTKLGPEVFEFPNGQEFKSGSSYYILRPG